MAKEPQIIRSEDLGSVEDVFVESITERPVNTKIREVTSKFVSDGVYKYVYTDTGEDVV